jgi:hypothetical protein
MGAVTIGLLVESSVTWVMLLLLWRRNAVIQSKLSEPRLIHDELLRRLSNSNAAAKAMLDACPESDHPGPCAQRRNLLSVAVAAVDEFASRSEEEPQTDYQ